MAEFISYILAFIIVFLVIPWIWSIIQSFFEGDPNKALFNNPEKYFNNKYAEAVGFHDSVTATIDEHGQLNAKCPHCGGDLILARIPNGLKKCPECALKFYIFDPED